MSWYDKEEKSLAPFFKFLFSFYGFNMSPCEKREELRIMRVERGKKRMLRKRKEDVFNNSYTCILNLEMVKQKLRFVGFQRSFLVNEGI